ncbi:hypothetical protein [Mesorhizobium temperatum]|uniref:hypothetical protein n=1 Tax=Mesorhizobium temperatum TaxID=241416 RepID=UPI00117EBE63|nr:hypothetical protein [Mesorhizobium temperatum]
MSVNLIWGLVVCMSGVPDTALSQGTMCNGRTPADAIVTLAENMKTNLIRVIIRIQGDQDSEAIEQETSAFASSLRRAGAVTAEPISGQPLVVAELAKDELLRLADDPRIVCVTRDEPEAAD